MVAPACWCLCVDVCVSGILLDELAARFYVVTHEHREDLVGFGCILYCHLLQEAALRIHCRLPQLLGVHLTKSFVALGMDACSFLTVAILVEERLALLVIVTVLGDLVLVRAFVEWGSGDIQMPFLDDLRHEAEEERHDQCVDVRTIDIGIGHDDDLVVTQLVDIGFTVILTVNAEAYGSGSYRGAGG